MKNKALIFIVCLTICRCKPSPQYMNGTWELVSLRHAHRNIVKISEDTISIPNYFTVQTELAVPLELSSDSLNAPNPCVKERYAYQLINDTFYIDSVYIMYRVKEVTSKQLFYNTHLDITLEDADTSYKHEAINREHHSIYIGKQRNPKRPISPSYFSDGYSLVINGIICDSSKMEDWFISLKQNSEEVLNLVLYKDKKCPSLEYQDFIHKIKTTLNKNTRLFESYFDHQAEYFLRIKEVKT